MTKLLNKNFLAALCRPFQSEGFLPLQKFRYAHVNVGIGIGLRKIHTSLALKQRHSAFGLSSRYRYLHHRAPAISRSRQPRLATMRCWIIAPIFEALQTKCNSRWGRRNSFIVNMQRVDEQLLSTMSLSDKFIPSPIKSSKTI
jgi:hypothetical protein